MPNAGHAGHCSHRWVDDIHGAEDEAHPARTVYTGAQVNDLVNDIPALGTKIRTSNEAPRVTVTYHCRAVSAKARAARVAPEQRRRSAQFPVKKPAPPSLLGPRVSHQRRRSLASAGQPGR